MELVVDPLPLPLRLDAARVVARCVQRELAELAGVPITYPRAARRAAFVDQVKAVAGGAAERAGPTAQAAVRPSGPRGSLEGLLPLLADAMEIGPPFGTRTDGSAARRSFRLPGEQALALVGDAADFQRPVAQVQEQRIAAARVVRPAAHGSAEAMGVMFRASQRDDRREFPPPVVRGIPEFPVEDVIQDRQGRRITGAGGKDNPFDVGQRRRQQIDLLASGTVLEQPFVPWEHDFLDRVQRPHEPVEQDLVGAARRLVTNQVRPDPHGRDDAFALVQPPFDKPSDCWFGDDLTHGSTLASAQRMKCSWSCCE